MPKRKMAKKKAVKKVVKKISAKKLNVKEKEIKETKSTVSYKSLLFGVISVIILIGLVVLAVSLLQKKTASKNLREAITSGEQTQLKENKKTYTVKAGDTLWGIAEKFYNNGFKFTDIVKENKIIDPGKIEKGTVLVIPNIESQITLETKKAESLQNNNDLSLKRIDGNNYTAIKGDNLWNIALRAYGDGFRWVDIARENKLANPGLIHAGNIFIIPR